MPDMLVPLLKLPALGPSLAKMTEQSIMIRRALPFEIGIIRTFVEQHFSSTWADEITVAYSYKPTSIFIAILNGEVVGFAGYECVCRGFFGPTGVAESERGKGIGGALLLASLHGLREMGYAYGVIGAAGPTEFYERVVGATIIPESVPGIYANPLKKGEF